jgi:hypothetical protein
MLHTRARQIIRAIDRAPVFSVLSFVLLIVVVALWIKSRHVSGALGLRDWNGHLHAAASDRNGVIFFFSNVPFGPEMKWTADALSIPADDFKQIHDWLYGKPYLKWHAIGFWFARGDLVLTSTLTRRFEALIVPYWLLLGALAMLPANVFSRLFARWRRGRRGRCRECGYDLRQSPGRCPECGVSVEQKYLQKLATQDAGSRSQ